MDQRYILDISYQGANYAGWQIQPNANTVQAELDAALSTLLRTDIRSTGAGRTDAGVHARQLIVHFDHAGEIPHSLLHGLNGILPYDIAANALFQPTTSDFHSRFTATSRSYVYQIVRQKSPEYYLTAHWIRYQIDVENMNRAAALLLEYDEFGSFCKAHADNATNLCQMYHAYWEESQDLLCFHIKANRFLRGMVRAIVGTLLLVGRGKMSLSEFRAVIEAQDRTAAGPAAEAKGLFLTEVGYPEESFSVFSLPKNR
ncbi:MAG: tRNA pseudouridine(38-40) synthase TruA [Bacteroidota bacterium]